jgi:hypothetical protein
MGRSFDVARSHTFSRTKLEGASLKGGQQSLAQPDSPPFLAVYYFLNAYIHLQSRDIL